ncbi:hypothetical protein NDU88_002790 [Pleurodeles waltl]|uniref:Uncharacterized protein n=1 Tax=Pleurodeles waltl TaxID=8319 RepID=A0AAV7MQP1_PLEWA|nr:hypothetical protein NDU88_002790 [Pleurodeles waltl]
MKRVAGEESAEAPTGYGRLPSAALDAPPRRPLGVSARCRSRSRSRHLGSPALLPPLLGAGSGDAVTGSPRPYGTGGARPLKETATLFLFHH